jgi:hypothetical protein
MQKSKVKMTIKNLKIVSKFVVFSTLLFSHAVFAQNNQSYYAGNWKNGLPVESLWFKIVSWILWPTFLLGAVGLIGFLTSLVMLVNPSRRKKGFKIMMWSVLAIIIFTAIYFSYAASLLKRTI